MPTEGVLLRGRDEILSYDEIVALVECLRDEFGLSKVRITGGEPLVREGIERLVEMLAACGVPDLALTTNGLRLAELAPRLKRAGLHRVNVSLDSLRAETFRRLSGGGELRSVLEGIDAALGAGLAPVKLNTVVVRGFNEDEPADFVAFACRSGCEARFIELMPVGPGAALFADGFVSSGEVRQTLARRFGLLPLPVRAGSSARRYRVTGADGSRGVVGFISSCSAPFCGDCTRLRLTADGRFIGCLARDGGVAVRELLAIGDTDSIYRVVRRVLAGKTAARVFEQEMAMASIGG